VGLPGDKPQSADGRIVDWEGFAGSLNDPPRPGTDALVRAAGQPAKVRVTALLANDQDPEADGLVFQAFDGSSVEGGQVTLDNGWLLYDPPVGWMGADAFAYTVEDAAGNRAFGTVAVVVAASEPGPSQNLIALTLLPNGHRRVTFAGIAGRLYAIEWADALPAVQWEALTTVVADARGLVVGLDTTEPPPAQRYYRTVGR